MSAAKIEVQGVSKQFDQAGSPVQALAALDLAVKEGEFVSIVGPSGCGKSTLLYMLGGFIPASSGRMLVDSRPVTGPGVDRGVVFQEYALFPWLTVFDNIAYGLREAGLAERDVRATAERYVRLIGLDGFESRFPRELSGGMKQRVALARTFAYEPGILLLDEPFGALDAQTREIMQDELLRLWRSTHKTVIMVTHDVSEAVYLSNRVCVMSQRPGRIVQEFTIDLDHSVEREEMVLSEAYTTIRNAVWLAVRQQVTLLAPRGAAG
ncbi:MAG: ABC transporter ATP-binding protein [Hyphomicrobiales bacterium]|nr:ABC transporter ATP-binding protein [Hyphomicrobiales bacterium]